MTVFKRKSVTILANQFSRRHTYRSIFSVKRNALSANIEG